MRPYLLSLLEIYMVGCKNGHKFFPSHQELETHCVPLDFDLGYVICFGQWDLGKRDTVETYKVYWGLPSHGFWGLATINK